MKYLKDTASAEKREVLHYHTVDSPEKLADLISKLNSCATFAFDTETTSQNPMEAKLVGMSFSFKEGEAYYIPCNGFHWDILPEVSDRFSFYGEDAGNNTSYILSKLKPLMENPGLFKTGQNAKYDIIVLKNYGVEVKGLVFDTMVSHYLLEPNARGHNLDAMSLKYLKLKKIPTSDLIGSGAKQITMDKVPVAMVSKYACEDADCAFRLTGILKREIPEKLLEKLFNEVELPLIAVLAVLERNGVAIDTLLLARMSDEIAEQLRQLEKRIHLLAGREFNINSPRQLSEILFEKLNLPVIRKTKTGLSTDEATLKKLSPQDPLPAEILNYRTLAKLKNTYTDALPQMINPHTGRIHTSYNQTVAATGRLSSSDPNLQNIPIRTELGGRIRAAFVAGKAGWKILSADYSQIELRILAHLSGDERLIDAFIKGEDIHQRTASLIFNCPLEVVSKEMRRSAKEVNFGVIYGMRDFGLSERLGIPRGRAKEFIDNYFNSYPKVLEFIEETIRKAKEKEIVSTMLGRIRPLPEINSSNHNIRQNAERIAVNTPIQGSAADLIKIAMINIQRRMLREKVDAMMIMQVHDELVFEVPESEMEAMQALVVEEMEGAMKLSLPLKAEASFADNWLEAH
jgi:DNA polymerase-1